MQHNRWITGLRAALLASSLIVGGWQSARADSSPAIATPTPTSSPLQAQTPFRDPARPHTDPLQPVPAPIAPSEPLSPPPLPVVVPPVDDATPILVRRIEVSGSTIFDAADFAPILQPATGQSLTLTQLRAIADALTQLYLDRGYITSRAVLVDQVIRDGIVQMRVIEGSLESIEIEGTRRLRPAYLRQRIALGGSTPLNQSHLEDQLRLLRLDPLLDNVEASLRAGSGLGQSILVVRVTEANPVIGAVSVDNYSTPSVGSERLGLSLGYQNLTGHGDTLMATHYRTTTSGSNQYDVSYQYPFNALNGTVQLRIAPDQYHITDPKFESLDIRGNASLYEVSVRQPLIRSPRQELALSLGLTHRSGRSLVSDIQIDRSTTTVLQFSQDYIHRDGRGAWALRSQFNIGTGLLDATTDGDPDGQFVSWLGQVQRVQRLSSNQVLTLQTDVQLTPNALLPSQQFFIGGGQSVRGYRQNLRSGDNGLRVSLEDRITVARDAAGDPTVQLIPFADMGMVWNTSPRANPDPNTLAALGLGLSWQPLPHLQLRLDYAPPLIHTGDRGTNAQDDGLFFSVNYGF